MDNLGRETENDVFDIINFGGEIDQEPINSAAEDDQSQFLNDSGDRLVIEPIDEAQTNNDGEENVGSVTKSGEVY